MMDRPFKLPFRLPSRANIATILVFGAVLLVLAICGLWYWKYVETQTLHLQERNFRALAVTGQSLAGMVANYEKVLKSIVEGNPCYRSGDKPCPENDRRKGYEKALRKLQGFKEDVMVTKAAYEDEGLTVKVVRENGASYIRLRYVHQDRAVTKWKIEASVDIGTVMRPLVTEEIFSDVLLADHMGRVLYHQPSRLDPSGFEFDNVSSLLHRFNDPSRRDGGAEKSRDNGTEDAVSTLPLFNDTRIGEVPYTIYAQAAVLPAQRGATQPLMLVGIVPAGQFHAEAHAIPLNHLLLVAGLLLTLFFVLPYVKLVTNVPTERLTHVSVTVLIVSSLLGTALLTFGLAAFATYHNLERYLNARLEAVSEEIRMRFEANVTHGLQQLDAFDESCDSKLDCWRRLRSERIESHLAQRLCIAANEGGNENGFSFFSKASDQCSEQQSTNGDAKVVFPDVNTIFWVGSTGELKILRSREPAPWKHVNLEERQYVRRIWEDETFTRGQNGPQFWIQPIYSWTTGNNFAVLSMKSTASSERDKLTQPIVAALEVRLPSVTGVGVPPGMGFVVINQEGEVLFHSDSRRNLRENFFEESDRDRRLRQAVFARATTQLDGRYWGKDRHFHIAPLFYPEKIRESPDVHWSLVTYWDRDMLRVLNLRALYSSGALFFIYAIISLSLGILGWWIYSRVNKAAFRWMWPQWVHLHPHQLALGLLVASLIAVGIWYARPHRYPDMLLWGLLPPLVAAVAVWSIIQTDAHPTGHDKTDVSAQRRYGRSYGLLATAGLLTFVVIPALVIFRVAVDVEWRLSAKFALFDLDGERRLQAQKVRESYPFTVFHETRHNGEVRTKFLREFSGSNNVYIDFPFQRCQQESENCREDPTNVVQRGDERLIRWLHHIIERPRVGRSGDETDMFLETPEQWHEPEWGTLGLKDRAEDRSQRTDSPINLYSIPSPIPPWLYSLLVFGCLVPLTALRVKNTYAFAAAIGVLGGFLWFGLVGEVLSVLGVTTLLYGAWYVLPMFAAQRVLLINFLHSSMDSTARDEEQGTAGIGEDTQPPDGWSPGLWDVFAKEMAGLRNALRLAGISWSDELTKSHETISKQDIEDDYDVVKERIIRKFLEKAANQYLDIWKKCTKSQRRSLFNLARDGFLHTKNPDIGPLLKSGLIVGDLILRPMNKSFRRFVITMGLKEHLDEDVAQARTSPWFQVSRPIGAGLVLIMVFLVLTQEQYRAITLAFLGVLPGLLGALSQTLTAHKTEA